MANIDFPASPTVGQKYTFAGVTYTFSAQGVWTAASSVTAPTIPQGRLTLQSMVPVMPSTTTGVTAIYYTPYIGNRVPTYDGVNVAMRRFTELTANTTDFTNQPAAMQPNQVYDWFVWWDTSTNTCRLTHSEAWMNPTLRVNNLIRLEGLLLNANAITNGPAAQRGTYVGTTMTNAAGTLDWIFGARAAPPIACWLGVWNMYNRAAVSTFVGDLTTTWSYASTVVREVNGNTTNKVHWVTGIAEDVVTATAHAGATGSSGLVYLCGVGYDVTTFASGTVGFVQTTGLWGSTAGKLVTVPFGKHYVSQLEGLNIDSAGPAVIWGGLTMGNGWYTGLYFDGRF